MRINLSNDKVVLMNRKSLELFDICQMLQFNSSTAECTSEIGGNLTWCIWCNELSTRHGEIMGINFKLSLLFFYHVLNLLRLIDLQSENF